MDSDASRAFLRLEVELKARTEELANKDEQLGNLEYAGSPSLLFREVANPGLTHFSIPQCRNRSTPHRIGKRSRPGSRCGQGLRGTRAWFQ